MIYLLLKQYCVYLAIIPEEEVLVLVVDDLDELVPDALEPEQGRAVVEVGQLVVQLGYRVVGHAQIGADAIRPEKQQILNISATVNFD